MKGQSQSAPRILSRRGQGTVELVLLLAASLAVLAVLRQFNDGFRAYVSNYYGAYLTCLLETGELPSLGYEGTSGECDTEFQPFTLANGRQPVDANSLGTPGHVDATADNGASGKNKNQSSASAQASATANASARGGGGAGSGSDSGGPSLIGGDQGRQQRVALSKADTGGGKGGTQFNQLGGFDSGGDDKNGRAEFVPAPNEQADSSGADLRKANVPAPDGSQDDPAVKRVPAEMNKKKIEMSPDQPLTFPDFIKIILIIALILMMLVFFGGQALQISKSGDK